MKDQVNELCAEIDAIFAKTRVEFLREFRAACDEIKRNVEESRVAPKEQEPQEPHPLKCPFCDGPGGVYSFSEPTRFYFACYADCGFYLPHRVTRAEVIADLARIVKPDQAVTSDPATSEPLAKPCCNCSARGPIKTREAAAINAWNSIPRRDQAVTRRTWTEVIDQWPEAGRVEYHTPGAAKGYQERMSARRDLFTYLFGSLDDVRAKAVR